MVATRFINGSDSFYLILILGYEKDTGDVLYLELNVGNQDDFRLYSEGFYPQKTQYPYWLNSTVMEYFDL